MRKISVAIALLALLACSGKKDKDGSGGKQGSADPPGSAAKVVDQPVKCPPGNVVKDGACVAVVTPEKVAVVTQQQSRLDELAKILDKVETIGAPVQLMNAIRQLPAWQDFAAKTPQAKTIDGVVATLDGAVKQLGMFKASVQTAAGGLGNLKAELDRLLQDTGAAKRIEEARAQISSLIRTTLEPLAKEVTETVQTALAPLAARFEDTADLVIGGCALMKVSGGGDKAKELCGRANELFSQGKKYLADLKTRPAALFTDISTKIETELAALIDEQVKQALDAAQTAVNDALKLPPAGSGSAAKAP